MSNLSDFMAELHHEVKQMAKLKQKDRRQSHEFKIGDLVSRHGAVGVGVVLATEDNPDKLRTDTYTLGEGYSPTQYSGRQAYCLFRPREFELRKEARRLLSTYNLGAEMKPLLAEIPFSQLSYEGRAPDSWFKPPSTQAVSKDRFADILEEEEDDGS